MTKTQFVFSKDIFRKILQNICYDLDIFRPDIFVLIFLKNFQNIFHRSFHIFFLIFQSQLIFLN